MYYYSQINVKNSFFFSGGEILVLFLSKCPILSYPIRDNLETNMLRILLTVTVLMVFSVPAK